MWRSRVCALVLGLVLGLVVIGLVQAQEVIEVEIDIKPGTDVNPINIKSQGKTPIAVLCTPVVNPLVVGGTLATVVVGDAEGERCRVKDVNGDDCDDVVCQFATPDLGVTCETTELTLVATLSNGTTLTGTDTVTPKPCKPGKE